MTHSSLGNGDHAAIANLLAKSAQAGHAAIAMVMWQVTIEAMLEHLRNCLPREGVGFLAAEQIGDVLHATRFVAGVNVAASNTRYALHPNDVEHMLRDIAGDGELLGAVVHSHPRGLATPSKLDIAEAALNGVLHVIVQLEPSVEMRAWRIAPGGRDTDSLVREVQIVAKGGDSDKLTGDGWRSRRSLESSEPRS